MEFLEVVAIMGAIGLMLLILVFARAADEAATQACSAFYGEGYAVQPGFGFAVSCCRNEILYSKNGYGLPNYRCLSMPVKLT